MPALIELAVFLAALTLITPPLGGYLAAVFEGPPNLARRRLGGLERLAYRLCRIEAQREMSWREYLTVALVFSGVSALALFCVAMGQRFLPLNPQGFANLPPLLAFNVAISFMTTPDDHGRTDRLPGDHQTARRQRGWLRRRELGGAE